MTAALQARLATKPRRCRQALCALEPIISRSNVRRTSAHDSLPIIYLLAPFVNLALQDLTFRAKMGYFRGIRSVDIRTIATNHIIAIFDW